ncbi:uncharacterized protein F4812DRAFT_431180 [Daldinia caldariorum]|uniref:uncharacterized protein n=1 Tax=Daldinia caldariorum TaxID=326644 RepID=UPI0020076C40|nr:uncharacterized protein F4812DRAFT_431180 [Daldinia caldariorum]KAI1467099.1 hypothetical protein F4812DRAFT_431180 [Daldinia caldariorum]
MQMLILLYLLRCCDVLLFKLNNSAVHEVIVVSSASLFKMARLFQGVLFHCCSIIILDGIRHSMRLDYYTWLSPWIQA